MTDDELIEPTGDFDELAAFLDREDTPGDWMPSSVLDGYLTGVAVSPTRLNPSDWMPKIWGDTPFESEAQANWALAAVMSRFNYINQYARGEEPGPLWPRLDSHPDGGPVVRGWAVGFVKAITLDMEAWRPLLDHERARVLLDPFFGYVGYRDANGEAVRTDATEAEPDGELAELLPGIVRAIHLFWTEGPPDVRDDAAASPLRQRKVGRNEPCPCGSGRKAKRCCGAG